ETNAGTVPPRLMTPRPPNPTRNISRRDTFMIIPRRSDPRRSRWALALLAQLLARLRELVFGHRHHHVHQATHFRVDSLRCQLEWLGLILRIAVHVVQERAARFARELAVDEQRREVIEHVVGRVDAVALEPVVEVA